MGRSSSTLGPWHLVDRQGRLSWWSDEGLATVPGAPTVYRGGFSVPRDLRANGGWDHIGDPDAHDGVIVDCFQGPAGATAKLYRATAPDGRHADHRHPLVTGELYNNSFVAIEPSGRWMVSGEWGEMRRLLVFAVPSPAGPAGDLPLAGTIDLDRPVRNVQGAAWIDPTTLLCSTDDPGTDLWPVARQLLQVSLDAPLAGAGPGLAASTGPADRVTAQGRVSCLGPLPLESRCRGTFEVEGLDYDATTGDLRVIVIPPAPCKLLAVTVYRYRRSHPGPP